MTLCLTHCQMYNVIQHDYSKYSIGSCIDTEMEHYNHVPLWYCLLHRALRCLSKPYTKLSIYKISPNLAILVAFCGFHCEQYYVKNGICNGLSLCKVWYKKNIGKNYAMMNLIMILFLLHNRALILLFKAFYLHFKTSVTYQYDDGMILLYLKLIFLQQKIDDGSLFKQSIDTDQSITTIIMQHVRQYWTKYVFRKKQCFVI